MSRVELVYFNGCPNVEQARQAIRAAGVEFSEVRQDPLSQDSHYRKYSSPTILVDGEIAVGSKNGASACSIIDWNAAPEIVFKLFSGNPR